MNQKPYFFALAHSNLLPRDILKLITELQTPQAVWNAPPHSFQRLTPEHRMNFLAFRRQFPLEQKWEEFERSKFQGIGFDDPRYPESLKTISDPPVFLFTQGNLNVLQKPALAIVGSRICSPYGKLESEKLAETLAGCGFVIVSGLARGIDKAAHEGALHAGETIAVLGSGLNHIYPPEHDSFAARITKQNLLVSEFPPDTPPLAMNFPRRNRIISGLSLGVIVVEAQEKSGALITAKFALEQGREVFALPGRPGSPFSKGANALIQAGAKLVQEISDVLEEFPFHATRERIHVILSDTKDLCLDSSVASLPQNDKDSSLSKEILAVLESSKRGIDMEELAHEVQVPIQDIAGTLTILETQELISRLPGNTYVALN